MGSSYVNTLVACDSSFMIHSLKEFHIPGIERFVEDDAVSFIIYVDEKPVGVVAYTEQGENSRMCANWLSITSKTKI